ncbi:MAG TPA: hypothetical protein PLO69_11280 [Gammaproteobacteria bacterium]|nr:hypothetical protein [Gammaproteobacteria bacterium]
MKQQSTVGGILLLAILSTGFAFLLRAARPDPAPARPLTVADAPGASAPSTSDGRTYQIHAAEARHFLGNCSYAKPAFQPACRQNQIGFMQLYTKAYSGDFGAMVATASAFSPPQSDYIAQAWAPGVPPNPVEACAWWHLLSLTTGHNPDYDRAAAENCDHLHPAARAAAAARERAIAVALTPVASPPEGWRPDAD